MHENLSPELYLPHQRRDGWTWHAASGLPCLTWVRKGLLAYAGNHHGRRLLLDWGWGNCEGVDDSPYCNGWAPWFGKWGKSEEDSSAAAASAAATGEQRSFMHSCWIFVHDKHGVLFHTMLYYVGYIHYYQVWGNICMSLWMRLWGYRPAWPNMHLDLLGL